MIQIQGELQKNGKVYLLAKPNSTYYHGYRLPFPEVNRPRRGVEQPHSS